MGHLCPPPQSLGAIIKGEGLQRNSIFWTWPDNCTQVLTAAAMAFTIPGQDQVSEHCIREGKWVFECPSLKENSWANDGFWRRGCQFLSGQTPVAGPAPRTLLTTLIGFNGFLKILHWGWLKPGKCFHVTDKGVRKLLMYCFSSFSRNILIIAGLEAAKAEMCFPAGLQGNLWLPLARHYAFTICIFTLALWSTMCWFLDLLICF